MQLRVLWLGDAGCTTGFARVSHEVIERLHSRGHSVTALAVNYRGEIPAGLNPSFELLVPTLSSPQDLYGLSRLESLLKTRQFDVIVMLNDLPVCEVYFRVLNGMRDRVKVPPTVLYTPIDAAEIPRTWASIADLADAVVTYTDWGRKELIRAGLDESKISIAPHGASADFQVITRENPVYVHGADGEMAAAFSRDSVRAAYGVEDKFVVLWADRNSDRKYPAGFLKAMAPICDQLEEVTIWMHCAQKDVGGNIRDMVSGSRLDGRVLVTPGVDTFEGIPSQSLRSIYAMADLKVSTAIGEGWGLTNCEALQCGTPTVAVNNPVNREVLGPTVSHFKANLVPSGRGVSFWVPDLAHVTTTVRRLITSQPLRQQMAEEGRSHVSQWSWDTCTDVIEQAIAGVVLA